VIGVDRTPVIRGTSRQPRAGTKAHSPARRWAFDR
jgi:hypothetical protein